MFGAGAAQRYAQAITQKTGLYAQGERMVGHFQGLPGWTQSQMVANVGSMMMGGGGGALGGLGALLGGSAGGMVHGMTGGDFLMKHDYVIEMPQGHLPGASLRESTSFLVNKGVQQRPAIGTRTTSGVHWIDQKYEVCALDPHFAPYVCASHELQQWLGKWPYLNLSWHGRTVWLELIDSTQRIHGKFGTAAMQNGDMVLWGMSVAAAAARATYAR